MHVRSRHTLDSTIESAISSIADEPPVTLDATRPAPLASFDLAVVAGRERVRIVLSGELDLAGSSPLDEAADLVRRARLPFSVDCWNVTFVDGAGMRALLRAKRQGGTLEGVHGPVRRLFDLLDLASELEPLPDRRTGDLGLRARTRLSGSDRSAGSGSR
jgi:anti-anti-sigma regulatory factor